jgi:hypothetical protein
MNRGSNPNCCSTRDETAHYPVSSTAIPATNVAKTSFATDASRADGLFLTARILVSAPSNNHPISFARATVVGIRARCRSTVSSLTLYLSRIDGDQRAFAAVIIGAVILCDALMVFLLFSK